VQASHVLAAMEVEPDLARGAVRISLGWSTTERDLEKLLSAWMRVASSLLKRRTNEGLAA
jgi:cysteine desulfurase